MTIEKRSNCIIEFTDDNYSIKTKRCIRTNFINFGDLTKYFRVRRLDLSKEFKKKCGYMYLAEYNYVCMEHLKLIKIPNEKAESFMKYLDEEVIPYLDTLSRC